MNQKKTVYILGAGSSISHSNGLFPNINNIFIKAIELNITTTTKGKLKRTYTSLNNYLKSWFGISLDNTVDQLDFEKVFTFIELENEKNPVDFGLPRKQLIEILLQVIIRLKDRIQNNETPDYQQFRGNLDRYDSIITFNWDILLDDYLGRLKYISSWTNEQEKDSLESKNTELLEKRNYAYGDFIDSFYLNNYYESSRLSRLRSQEGFFLKLHGSVDWKMCKNPFCEKHNHPFPVLFPLKNRECDYCLEKTEILIVPPVLQKAVNQSPLIRTQWNIAEKEITRADKIVIWGYSLPPTDFHAEWLLRKCGKNKQLSEIVIINPNSEHIDKFDKIIKELPINPRVTSFNSFADYIANN
jgi:hypothetical protein